LIRPLLLPDAADLKEKFDLGVAAQAAPRGFRR
jgi:hypothetical protein